MLSWFSFFKLLYSDYEVLLEWFPAHGAFCIDINCCCFFAGVYTCWLQGHRAAQVYLLVYAHLGKGQPVTSHRDFPGVLRSTLKSYLVMSAVFCFLLLSRAFVRFLRDNREEHMD